MPQYKATLFFQDTGNGVGWTESWYLAATNPSSAIGTMGPVITARLGILMDTGQITVCRVSNVDSPRDSLYQTVAGTNNGAIVTATYPIAGVWDCLLVVCQSVTYNLFGHVFLHDVPAGIFNGRVYHPSGVPAGVWQTPYNTWNAAIISAGLQKKQKGPLYTNVTSIIALRRTERKLGRPFDALRGRRSVA